MEQKWKYDKEKKKHNCLIELEQGETLLILSKNDKAYFLQVAVDEYDDLVFAKRNNFRHFKRQVKKQQKAISKTRKSKG